MFTSKHLCLSLVLIKLQAFSCKYCEIFKKTSFEEHLPTAASGDKNYLNAVKYSANIFRLSPLKQTQSKLIIYPATSQFRKIVKFFLYLSSNPLVIFIISCQNFNCFTRNRSLVFIKAKFFKRRRPVTYVPLKKLSTDKFKDILLPFSVVILTRKTIVLI